MKKASIFSALFALLLICSLSDAIGQVTLTPATGGTLICSNKAVGGSAPAYTTISPITITETTPADLTGGAGASTITDVLTIVPPTGWRFNTVAPTLSFTGGGNITSMSVVSITAALLTININVTQMAAMDAFTITGLQVQASTTTSAPGYMYATTATGIAGITTGTAGSNFGNLSQSPGPVSGPAFVCQGQNVTLTDAVAGGTWSSSIPARGAVGLTTGVVSGGGTLGAFTITYTVAGCTMAYPMNNNSMPAPITGGSFVCQYLTTLLSDATVGGLWSSGSPLVATIGSTTGVVSGLGTGGVAAMNYTLANGCFVTKYVTVNTPPAPITGDNEICSYETTVLSEAIGGGVWSCSTPTVASVDATGFVTGVSSGTSAISYTITSCPPAIRVVTVDPTPQPINGITSICNTVSTVLTDSTAGGYWSSSDPSVATISSTGAVTDVDSTLGASATITYTLPTGCFVTTIVTVQSSATAMFGPDSICTGASTVLYDTTLGGIWSSTNLAIASIIDTSGVVTGHTTGLVNISYTLPNGCFSVKPFFIKPLIPASVNITATPGDSVCAGTPVTFNATSLNGGIPTFNWKLFYLGTYLGDTTTTLVYTPVHGDVILCEMVTHGICSVSDTVYDTFAVNVLPNVKPRISIRITDTSNVAPYYGKIFIFYTDVTYGGTAPTFQWYIDGTAVSGATGRTFSTPVYKDEYIYCIVRGIPPCNTITDTGWSNRIYVYANYLGVNNVGGTSNDFSLYPNPNNGSFTLTGSLDAMSNNEISIEVSNVLGQVVYMGNATLNNGKVNEQVLLGNSLPEGSYILRVNSGTKNEVIHFDISK